MKKLLTVACVCACFVLQAQLFSPPYMEWGKTYGGAEHDRGISIGRTDSTLRVLIETQGDGFPYFGGSYDARALRISPETGTVLSQIPLAGAGNDFPEEYLPLRGDTSDMIVRSWGGTPTSVGINDVYGPYQRSHIVRFAGTEPIASYIPTVDGGFSSHMAAVDPETGNVFWVCQRGQYVDMNGLSTYSKSVVVIKLSPDLEPIWSNEYGFGADTSEQPQNCIVADGKLLIGGWLSKPDWINLTPPIMSWLVGSLESIDCETGEHQSLLTVSNIPSGMVRIPGIKKVVVGYAREWYPSSQLIEVNPLTLDTVTRYVEPHYYPIMNMVPTADTTVIYSWFEDGDTAYTHISQVDVAPGTATLRSTIALPCINCVEYVMDAALDRDSTYVVTGYTYTDNGGISGSVFGPHVSQDPYYDVFFGKFHFPIETFHTIPDTPTTIVEHLAEHLLYPNPIARGNSFIYASPEKGSYIIYNVMGSQVGSGLLQTNRTEIPTGILSPGMYFFRTDMHTMRFVISE